jgi:hypothetical protein
MPDHIEEIRKLGKNLDATFNANGGSYAASTDSICLAIIAKAILSELPEPELVEEDEPVQEEVVATPEEVAAEPEKPAEAPKPAAKAPSKPKTTSVKKK